MEERDEILIGRYLANELSETERTEVEQRMKEDPLFRQEVLTYEMARDALRLGKREELRDRFKKRDITLDLGPGKKRNPNNLLLTWLSVAALVVLILYLSKFDHFFDRPAEPVSSNGRDTIEKFQSKMVDSLLRDQKPKTKSNELHKDKMQVQQQIDMADAKKKGEELFAEYFEPYKDESMSPVTRGEKELSPLDKFRKYYWEENYQATADAFPALRIQHQQNDNIRFIYALSLAAISKPDEAQPILKGIVVNNRSIYIQEAYWHLGLLYLRQGDIPNARKFFQITIDDPDGYNKKEASELLNRLK
jgi:hypothetical protein